MGLDLNDLNNDLVLAHISKQYFSDCRYREGVRCRFKDYCKDKERFVEPLTLGGIKYYGMCNEKEDGLNG